VIGALKALFEAPGEESEAERQHREQLAAACLLLETARADFTQDAVEEQAMLRLLEAELGLSAGEIRELVALADREVDAATSLYEFTRVINDGYSDAEKVRLIDLMWRVAYADGELDKYEEHLIRRVAELTYVPHEDFIRSKHRAAGTA
jgi:uncharacterized tellurite resistance protein B-like protein